MLENAQKTLNKLADGMSVVRNSPPRRGGVLGKAHGLWWAFVFIIQLLVPITLILINLVFSMNSFCLVHFAAKPSLWEKLSAPQSRCTACLP
jgi:hypothetical protein